MKFKLDKKAKVKWVKALRSGKYKQAKAALYQPKGKDTSEGFSNRGYCCLGVACAIGLTKPENNDLISESWFVNTEFIPKSIQRILATKNDRQNWTFEQIANFIEKNL